MEGTNALSAQAREEERSDDRLSTRMNMDVLDDNPLLSAATQLGQRVRLRSKRFGQASDGQRI